METNAKAAASCDYKSD